MAAGPFPRRLLILSLGALLLLALLVWQARSWMAAQEEGLDLFAAPVCDLHQGPCDARRGEQSLRLTIEGPIHSHRPLPLRVEVVGMAPDRVEVDFQGVEMDMGHNRFVLEPRQDGSYRGEGQLPACPMGPMLWRARVLVAEGNATTGSWFDFTAG